MSARLRLSLLALGTGVALGVVAALAAGTARRADASPARNGGVLRINLSNSDVTSLDPAIDFEAYGAQLILATCTRLLRYPDLPGRAGTRLVPDASDFPSISKDGRTYTFQVHPGFRFSTGAPVTAASFERAFVRAASKVMGSPAINFMGDIVGATAYHDGKAKRIRGVTAQGNRLTVQLTRVAPDFLNRVAMTFFCAVPADLPIERNGVKLPPTAGPYKFVSRTPGRFIVLEKNAYYHGPRPGHVDRIEVTVRTNPAASVLQIEKGERDWDINGVPAAAAQRLGKKYGVNRPGGQFHVNPALTVNYLAMNTQRPPFDNANLRKAVNYAIDRTEINRQAGAYAGRPTDQVLPPNMPGYRAASIYPLKPNLAKAKQLAGDVNADVTLYFPIDPAIQNQAVVIQQNLKPLGLDVTLKPLPFDVLLDQLNGLKSKYDMIILGWIADYPDPSDFLNILLSGKSITAQYNNNLALLDDPAFNQRLDAAIRLRGDQRYQTYGQLDLDLMRTDAPWAALNNPNQREFVSKRVGCYAAPGAYSFMSLAAVCLK
jgi:ABC-type oligopeptide transport system substrate-binding subunit